MEDTDTGKEALEKRLEQAKDGLSLDDDVPSSKEDDPPSPSFSSSEEEENTMSDSADEEAKKDLQCKEMVKFYLNHLEDMEQKCDLFNFWFMDKVEPTLKNLNYEYECHKSQLVIWNDEGRDPHITKVLDMLHNVYLLTTEHVMKPRKSTRIRNIEADKAKAALAEAEATTGTTERTKQSKRTQKPKRTQKAANKPKPSKKRSVGRGKDTESSVPPKKRINRGRDSKKNADIDPQTTLEETNKKTDNVIPPKPTEEEKRKKAVVLKNGTLKRSVYSRPTSVPSMKDQTSRNKFQCCAKHIKELQYCTTFGKSAERNFNPKVQHFMFTYDTLVQKPHLNKALPVRPEPVCIFLPPEGCELKSLAKMLRKVATEMEKKSGKGYRIAKSAKEYSELVYGPNLQPSSSKKAPPKDEKSFADL